MWVCTKSVIVIVAVVGVIERVSIVDQGSSEYRLNFLVPLSVELFLISSCESFLEEIDERVVVDEKVVSERSNDLTLLVITRLTLSVLGTLCF